MKKIIFPELGSDARVAEAVERIEQKNLATVVRTDEIPHDSATISRHCAALRKWDHMTQEQQDTMIADPLTWSLIALKEGAVDTVIAGAQMTTADVLRGAIRIIGMRAGISSLSSCFVLEKDGERLIFADCAVNIDPTPQMLADTAWSCIDVARKIDIEPRIAFLSYATGNDGNSVATVQKVADAYKMFGDMHPEMIADGPLQFDAAYDTTVYKQKSQQGIFAEESANIFVFPNLDSGNICYKVARELGGYSATGPILLGADKEVHDLSRGCSVQDIVNLVKFSLKDVA